MDSRQLDLLGQAIATVRATTEAQAHAPPATAVRKPKPAPPPEPLRLLVKPGRTVLRVEATGPRASEVLAELAAVGAMAAGRFVPIPRVRSVRGVYRFDLDVKYAGPDALERTERAVRDAMGRGGFAAKPDPHAAVGAPRLGKTDVRPILVEAVASRAAPAVHALPRGTARLPFLPLTFWLGTHEPSWLTRTNVPLFVSRTRFYDASGRLARRLPRAAGPWALDSGGFTEVGTHGGWRIQAARYAEEVRRLTYEVGNLFWAAPMDWMVEETVLARTGLTLAQHQELTTVSVQTLRQLAPDLPIVPVLQGWSIDDYLRHRDQYAAVGIDLTREPLVGVGTMCRRTACPADIAGMLRRLRSEGIPVLHAFGVKTQVLGVLRAAPEAPAQQTLDLLLAQGGVRELGTVVASADSLAWSAVARTQAFKANRKGRPDLAPMIPGHVHGRTNSCANCLEWAFLWRRRVLAAAGVTDPPGLFVKPPRAGEDVAE